MARVYKVEKNNSTFTRNFLYNTCSENALESIDQYTDSALRGYYNGTHNISRIASFLIRSYDKKKFYKYVDMKEKSDEAMKILFEEFSHLKIDEYNYKKCLSDEYQRILNEAAGIHTEKKTNNQHEHADEIQKFKQSLLIQSKCKCPKCGKRLFTTKNANFKIIAKVIKIDPKKNNKSANLIALCPQCAAEYEMDPSEEEINQLKQWKRELIDDDQIDKTISNMDIEKGIRDLLIKIGNSDIAEENGKPPLNFDPVQVKQKIDSKENFLCNRIIRDLTSYYSYVHSSLKDLSDRKTLNFELLCLNVKSMYIKLRDQNLEQRKIYNAMVDWLVQKAGMDVDRLAAEIVISYFVQDCEVFDEITK